MLRALDGSLQAIARVAEYVHDSRSDVDSGGSLRSPGRVAEASEHASFMVEHGLPLGIQDLPGYVISGEGGLPTGD
jgi:hypothetical protein